MKKLLICIFFLATASCLAGLQLPLPQPQTQQQAVGVYPTVTFGVVVTNPVTIVLPSPSPTPTPTPTGSATPTPTSTSNIGNVTVSNLTPQFTQVPMATTQAVSVTNPWTPVPQFTQIPIPAYFTPAPMATTQGVSVTNPVVQFTQVPLATAMYPINTPNPVVIVQTATFTPQNTTGATTPTWTPTPTQTSVNVAVQNQFTQVSGYPTVQVVANAAATPQINTNTFIQVWATPVPMATTQGVSLTNNPVTVTFNATAQPVSIAQHLLPVLTYYQHTFTAVTTPVVAVAGGSATFFSLAGVLSDPTATADAVTLVQSGTTFTYMVPATNSLTFVLRGNTANSPVSIAYSGGATLLVNLENVQTTYQYGGPLP